MTFKLSIPAGIDNLNFYLFLVFSTTRTLIWNTILVLLGANLEHISYYMDRFFNVVYLLIILLIFMAIGWYIKIRSERKNI